MTSDFPAKSTDTELEAGFTYRFKARAYSELSPSRKEP